MPETRSNLVIEIADADREMDLKLSIDFDVNGSGGIENPTVRSIEKCVFWFGEFGGDLEEGDNSMQIRRFIETKYEGEIRAAIVAERERERWAET